MPRLSFTGIVLAGGRSSRMGRDKALLEHGGRTLLECAIDVLTAAGASRVLVSGDRPLHGGIPDAVPELGPVGGLASVLADCDDGIAVVVPVDMPRLSVETVDSLARALGPARAVLFEGHPLPCALVVDGAVRGAIAAALASRPAGPSMKAVLHALGALELPLADPGRLDNVNTPAAWAGYIA